MNRQRFSARRRSLTLALGAATASLASGCATWIDLGWDKSKDAVRPGAAAEPQRNVAPAPLRPEDRTVQLPGGATLALIHIPGGRFAMGSPEDEPGRVADERQHVVALTQPYWLGRTEVTQAQWTAVMQRTIEDQRRLATQERAGTANAEQALWGVGPAHPMYYVSWDEAVDFCRRVNALESERGRIPAGYGFWLPTEAQWEFACRAGSTGPHAAGGTLDEQAWYEPNAGGTTHPVGTKVSNAWGLHDMQGNVSEWCADHYGDYPSGTVIDPLGPESGANRVERGGHWANPESLCRAARRNGVPGNRRYSSLGFRLALRSM